MSEQVDLEIFVIPRDVSTATYEVQVRVVRPDDQAGSVPARAEIRIDDEKLLELAEDPRRYGQALFEMLLPVGRVRSAFQQGLTAARELDVGVRARLTLDMPHLQTIAWETLRDEAGGWLLTDTRFFFSRFLEGDDGRRIKLTPKGTLSAVIAVASPVNLVDRYPDLAPVDVPGEIARGRTALGTIPVVVTLGGPGTDGRPTRVALATALIQAKPDILYLVCHGAVRDNKALVLLEKDDGTVDIVPGSAIADRIRDLSLPPRLVVLASCFSAGEGGSFSARDEGALTALGPLLARAGVPAVLAMQGTIEMTTIRDFMPRFFTELSQSRSPDRAVAAARSVVRDKDDAHQPVLFSRLREGKLWYEPGFGRPGEFDSWGDLVNALAKGECLPIIGPGLLDPFLGDSGEMARRWAEKIRFPGRGRANLTEVAQFIASIETREFLVEEMCDDWRERAIHLGQRLLSPAAVTRFRKLPSPITAAALSKIISAVGAGARAAAEDDAYKVLARMKVPIYVSTTPDNLLFDALLEAKRRPRAEVLCWNDRVEPWFSALDNDKAGYVPSVKEPVVYHLFGHFDRPTALVMTEDDYFDYLMTVGNRKVPAPIRRALTGQPLLFLGFQVDDWRFRVLYRSIVTEERIRRIPGSSRRSVSVQLEPEQDVAEPARLRRTLERHFGGARVETYWGTAQDFASDLHARWKAKGLVV